MILGYTRNGLPIIQPTRGAPDTNDIRVFHRTKAKFRGWTKGDHEDARSILLNRGEYLSGKDSAAERKIGSYCTRWSSVHFDLGYSSR
jgi:hypothetical protein